MTRSDKLVTGAGQKHTVPIKSMAMAVLAGVVSLFPLTACDRKDAKKGNEPAPTSFACDCDFLTDMDDASKQLVQVCEITLDRAQSAAMGCAQSGAPATIQSCACRPAADPHGCKVGDCTVSEHR